MKCFIGLGSNLGDRSSYLAAASLRLQRLSVGNHFRISPRYTTPALMPEGAPLAWNIPYLNAVAEIEWNGSPQSLLQELQKIENDLGRTRLERWAPRTLDLDLLIFGTQKFSDETLTVPHPGLSERSFVLDPLKDLAPGLLIANSLGEGKPMPAVVLARKLRTQTPLIMGILNLTPDSFSDGGDVARIEAFAEKVDAMTAAGVQVLDLGAESTRPGAELLTAEDEWARLKPALLHLQARFSNSVLRPLVSVDTTKSAVAERALEHGADWINDVSGISEPEMLQVLKKYPHAQIVMMHSLSVPADPRKTLSDDADVIETLKRWFQDKLSVLDEAGIDRNRVIFDPGVGFGKTAAQSLAILKRMDEFSELQYRVLVGHSRKSFLKQWSLDSVQDRDIATLGVSMGLVQRGVDILRVHSVEQHLTALNCRAEVLQ